MIFECGPINFLVLLGYSDIFEALIIHCKKNEIHPILITCKNQAPTLKRLLKKTDHLIVENIDCSMTKNFLNQFNLTKNNFIAISFGARWIFKKDTIEKLFLNKLINAHGSRLPFDKGGGGFSWRIMRGDRLGNLLLHVVDSGIDTGPVIINEEYVIPSSHQIPADIETDYKQRLITFITGFIENISKSNCKFELTKQAEYIGSYNPRLSTKVHSWIDWSWSPNEILRFIHAFDSPYSGAQTTINKTTVSLKNVQLHSGEIKSHPFQNGLITRKSPHWIIVSLSEGQCLIIEKITDTDGENMIPLLHAGDRLYTPRSLLEKAYKTRVFYKTNPGHKSPSSKITQ